MLGGALTVLLWAIVMWVYIVIALVIESKIQWYDWVIVITYTIGSLGYTSYRGFMISYNSSKSKS